MPPKEKRTLTLEEKAELFMLKNESNNIRQRRWYNKHQNKAKILAKRKMKRDLFRPFKAGTLASDTSYSYRQMNTNNPRRTRCIDDEPRAEPEPSARGTYC
jgi:hypothetical protein